MRELRLAKLAMTASLALFALVVAFGNLTDYGSNFAFVQHVLSMDTTFPGNALEPAFRIYITILAVLIFVSRPDGDLT